MIFMDSEKTWNRQFVHKGKTMGTYVCAEPGPPYTAQHHDYHTSVLITSSVNSLSNSFLVLAFCIKAGKLFQRVQPLTYGLLS